jgi:hypothetical protein
MADRAAVIRELITRLGYQVDEAKLKAFLKGTDKAKDDMAALAKRSDRAAKAIRRVGAAIVAAVAGAKVASIFGDMTQELKEAQRRAAFLGTSVQEVQRLGFAGVRAGLEIDEVPDLQFNLVEKAQKALRGEKAEIEKLGLIGLKPGDLKGVNGELISSTALLKKVADRVKGLDYGKAGDAMDELAGDVGRRAIRFLQLGSEGIGKLTAEADRLGVTMNDKLIADTQEAAIQSQRLKARLVGVRNAIAAAVLPAINRATAGFASWIQQGKNLEKVLIAVKVAAIAAGLAISRIIGGRMLALLGRLKAALIAVKVALSSVTIAAVAAHARLILLGGGVALLVFALVDLIRIAATGEGFLKRFLSTESVEALRTAFIGLAAAAEDLWIEILPAFQALGKAASPLLVQLGKLAKSILPTAIKGLAQVLIVALRVLTVLVRGVVLLVQLATRMAQFLRQTFGAEIAWIELRWNQAVAAIRAVWDAAIAHMATAVDSVRVAWEKVKNAVVQAILAMLAVMAAALDWVLEKAKAITGPIADAFTWAADKAKAAWDKVGSAISSAWEKTKSKASQLREWIDPTNTLVPSSAELGIPTLATPAGALAGPRSQQMGPVNVNAQVNVSGSANMDGPEFNKKLEEGANRVLTKAVNEAYRNQRPVPG